MATAKKPAVSFIGLGAMGFGMATNLIKEGYAVTGFDVWPPTLERFEQAGGSKATTPAEAVAGKDYCVCMVATAQQANSVLFEIDSPAVPALPQGATLLLCSTVPCAYVQSLAKQLENAGRGDIHLIDCPVSGGTIRAADGTLSIMAGASDAALKKGKDLLQAMSDHKKLYIVQGGVGAGSNLKMCHQVLAANQILSANEALGFAAHLGLDLKTTADTILKSEGQSWMFENRMPRILAANHKPIASAVTIILKDTSIITSEARRCEFPTPMTSTAEQVYFAGLGRGYGADDDGSLIRLYTEGVGKVGPVKGLADTEEAKLSLVVNLLKGIHICSAAETLAFASHVGLDLDQVFDLCINAAGGSAMLQTFGPEMMKAFQEGKAANVWSAGSRKGLAGIITGLEEAIEEAQRLKMPMFLGGQALSIMRLATHNATDAAAASVVKVWIR